MIIINLDSVTDPKEVAITSVSEQYEGDGVIVTLEWTQENPLYTYNVSVIPVPIEITFTGKARAQMKISYNTSYNVTVVASSPCGQGDATNFTELYYYSEYNNIIIALKSQQSNFNIARCGLNLIEKKVSVAVHVMGVDMKFGYQGIEVGSIATFSCPPGLVLIGPNSSTCMGNGEWEPDPREVKCNTENGEVPN